MADEPLTDSPKEWHDDGSQHIPAGWVSTGPEPPIEPLSDSLALAVIEAARGVVAEWTIRGDGGCETVRRDRLIAALTAYEDQRTDA